MQHLLAALAQLGFSTVEAQTYVTLVQYGRQNGSQIARRLGISRSSVYHALTSLALRGAIVALPGETQDYEAEAPEKLFTEYQANIKQAIDTSIAELQKLQKPTQNTGFINFHSEVVFHRKCSEFLEQAKEEIYLSSDANLEHFSSQFLGCLRRGVRVIQFSFRQTGLEKLGIEVYYNPNKQPPKKTERTLMVCDRKRVLLASRNEHGEISGLYSEHPMLVAVLSEHIHHDIYLMKLRQKEKREIITPDILINSKHEENNIIESDF